MWRTNHSTKGHFTVAGVRRDLGRESPFTHRNIPRETMVYMRTAKKLGLMTRFEVWDLNKLRSRGFVTEEPMEQSEHRKDYIRNHLNTMPFIVIRGKENDIIDGNHRWTTYLELGITKVPVLRVSGSKEALKRFEDFVQDFNKHPPYVKDAVYGPNRKTNKRTREKFGL